ncbi:MAG: hypothetical protein ABR921_14860 [Candidatus Sulfotelmatobacter sp.]|jgi:hypothetical protein
MAKRTLRVVKLGTAATVGVCTHCARTFNVPLDGFTKTSDAQESLRKQFDDHTCALLGSLQ